MSRTFGRSLATSRPVTPTGSLSRPKPDNDRSGWAMSVHLRKSMGRFSTAVLAALSLVVTADAEPASLYAPDPLHVPDTQLEPVQWSDLDGWSADDHAAAYAAF